MARTTKFIELKKVFAVLHGPDGCPWDRKQTHETLLRNLREEVREFAEAVKGGRTESMCEELGDVLLLVMFNAQIAERDGRFTVEDVIDGLIKKLKRRHPHVFGSVKVKSARQALMTWRKAKEKECSSNQ